MAARFMYRMRQYTRDGSFQGDDYDMDPAFRLVLIDDDPDLRKLIALALSFSAGWDVTTAAGGVEGIDEVRRIKPDAVVVDIMMPEVDGYEVCRRLKADPETAAIPVVFLTARTQIDEAQIRELGAAGVIIKPFDTDTIAERILELCR